MGTPAIVLVLNLLTLSVLAHFAPLFTRPDLFFGVTVTPAFRQTDAARRLLSAYRVTLWCFTAVTIAMALSLRRPTVAILVYVVAVFGTLMVAHHRALRHATARTSVIEIDLAAPVERIPGGLVAALLPFVGLLGLGLWAVTHADRLPQRLTVHWGLNGPDRWMNASPSAVITLLAVTGLACLVLVAMAFGVLYWSRRISASGPAAASERQFRRGSVLLILVCEYFIVLPAAFSLLQAPILVVRIWGVTLIVTLVAFIVILMRSGQGGARLMKSANGMPVGDRMADDCWIGGMIYVNRKDPALLVEKRMGIGWTLNFGNPWSWVLLPAIVAIPVLISHGRSTLTTASRILIASRASTADGDERKRKAIHWRVSLWRASL